MVRRIGFGDQKPSWRARRIGMEAPAPRNQRVAPKPPTPARRDAAPASPWLSAETPAPRAPQAKSRPEPRSADASAEAAELLAEAPQRLMLFVARVFGFFFGLGFVSSGLARLASADPVSLMSGAFSALIGGAIIAAVVWPKSLGRLFGAARR